MHLRCIIKEPRKYMSYLAMVLINVIIIAMLNVFCDCPTCGMLATILKHHAKISMIRPRLSASFKLRGCTMAKYLSKLMVTRMNDERYNPRIRKNMRTRQAGSPAFHATVMFQIISRGSMMKVTTRSAMDRWKMNWLTRDLMLRFLNNVMNTVRFPHAATMNMHV